MEARYKELSVAMQCSLLGISRGAYYYQSRQVREDRDVADLQLILDVLQELPFGILSSLVDGHPFV